MTAAVRGVTSCLIDTESTHTVGSTTSANLTTAPASAAELAVEIHDTEGTITSLAPTTEAFKAARTAISSPCVAFPTAIAYIVFENSANSCRRF